MIHLRSHLLPFGFLVLAATSALGDDLESEAIRYSETTPANAVNRLQARIEAGDTTLEHDREFGYLRSLLAALEIPESSQMLVFTKTSLQRSRISPRRPRALYFNDDVYVGYCQQGDVLEVSATDPRLGTVFYTLDQTRRTTPEFVRQTDKCLICHSSSSTGGIPGHVLRSVYSDAGGLPLLASGTYRTDFTSPLVERWGGWYVTGTHGDQPHLGNLTLRNPVPRRDEIDNSAGLNVTDLADRFRTSAYPTPHSDIVALLVHDHQTATHNAITRANFRTREALWYEMALDKAFDDVDDELRESTRRRIENAGEQLVKSLLFSEEAPLVAPVAGTSKFAEEFAARGPRDDRERSLRDLDLRTRVFRYPCSYLVYSESFDALPTITREYVLGRLHEVLTGRDRSAPFAHLTDDDRRSILEILIATKPNLPASWRAAPQDVPDGT